MRKTARPVVWEGDGGAIPVTPPDPIADLIHTTGGFDRWRCAKML
jgi:hypothetical protein